MNVMVRNIAARQSIFRHPGESRDPGCKPDFLKNMLQPGSRVKPGMTVFAFIAVLLFASITLAKAPDVGQIPRLEFNPPQPTRHVLSNGVIVYLLEDHELPVFDLSLRMKVSPSDQPEGKLGTIDFMGDIWRAGGTKKRSPEKLNEELELIAAGVETDADLESAVISLSCLSKDIDQGLEIFADVLFHPQFRKKQLNLAKLVAIEELKRKNETPHLIASRAFRDILFGKEHVYGRNLTEKRVKKINRSDLVRLHKNLIVPDHAMISVSGDFIEKELIQKLENFFSDWKPVGRKIKEYDYSVTSPMAGEIFYVEKDFNQSRVLFGILGISRHDPDKYPLALANYILGASGTSRLFAQIRSRLGLAYVVGSFYSEPEGPGFVGAAAQTRAEATLAVVEAMKNELKKMSSQPPEFYELDQAKEATINSFVFNFDSPAHIVSQKASNEFFGYPENYLETYLDKIRAVSADDILGISQKYFSPERMKLLIVGDKTKFGGRVESLGTLTAIPLKEID